MADFESLNDAVEQLRFWSMELPPWTGSAERGEFKPRFGERHGSWFLVYDWLENGLAKSAGISFTNPEPLPLNTATVAVVSVRSIASTRDRFVAETIYERRRSVTRLDSDQLKDWFNAAIARADEYSVGSLSNSYQTGPGPEDRTQND